MPGLRSGGVLLLPPCGGPGGLLPGADGVELLCSLAASAELESVCGCKEGVGVRGGELMNARRPPEAAPGQSFRVETREAFGRLSQGDWEKRTDS